MEGLNTNINSEVMAVVNTPSSSFKIISLGKVAIIISLIIILIFLLKYIRSINLERRFSKFTINSSKNKSISLFDNIHNLFLNFINKFSNLLSKSEILSKKSMRYEKYRIAFSKEKNNMDFFSEKIILGISFIIFSIIVNLINSKLLHPVEFVIPFLLGYFTIDIIYAYKYLKYKKRLEDDLFEAITLMNNAFKAGMSILQAIDLVSKELDGPISIEFKKISMELSLGLDVEVAFKRFSDRVKLEEASYLTAGLSVLNKTGGNIIKVFDSIEKTIFSKKKLKQELKALTSSSKLIMWVLIFVPLIFAVFINIINSGYFMPLFSNPLGIILIIIMLIIYITYIIVVRKVMSVRGV